MSSLSSESEVQTEASSPKILIYWQGSERVGDASLDIQLCQFEWQKYYFAYWDEMQEKYSNAPSKIPMASAQFELASNDILSLPAAAKQVLLPKLPQYFAIPNSSPEDKEWKAFEEYLLKLDAYDFELVPIVPIVLLEFEPPSLFPTPSFAPIIHNFQKIKCEVVDILDWPGKTQEQKLKDLAVLTTMPDFLQTRAMQAQELQDDLLALKVLKF